MPAFPCTKCGACCKSPPAGYGLPVASDGWCANLAKDNTCTIYATRPAVCRVDAAPFVQLGFRDRAEWHAANLAACALLQKATQS